jgi:hypothetical protein
MLYKLLKIKWTEKNNFLRNHLQLTKPHRYVGLFFGIGRGKGRRLGFITVAANWCVRDSSGKPTELPVLSGARGLVADSPTR